MPSFPPILKASFGAFAFLAMAAAGARADEPTPAALGYADRIFVDIGVKASMDQIIPVLFTELERNVLKTNPELKAALDATLRDIEPDFIKTEAPVMADIAKALATAMSEQELKEAAAFFDSPAGKKFVASQPAVLDQVGNLARAWRDKLSGDILERTRAEMKKKGVTF